MNYLKIYNNLISKRQLNPLDKGDLDSTERHHILPRSMGGTDLEENLVRLTCREHFIAHLLLAKVYPNSGMVHAAYLMACFKRRNTTVKVTSHVYEYLRINHSKRVSENEKGQLETSLKLKGRKQSDEHILSRTQSRLANGSWHSESAKKNIGKAHAEAIKNGRESPLKNLPQSKEAHAKGVATRRARGSYEWSESQREKMSLIIRPSGYKLSEERILKIKESHAIEVVCPHCGLKGRRMIMGRWHFNNCKLNTERKLNDET